MSENSPTNDSCIGGSFEAIFVYPRAYRCIGINQYCANVTINKGWSTPQLNMRRKAETLQFTQSSTGSSVNLPKKLLYSRVSKNQNSETLTWATQRYSGVGNTNFNMQYLSPITGRSGKTL